jgi:rhamnosyltransferase
MTALSSTVVVRSKNKESTIEATLQSIRAQTVPAEIVLVDSGSTDSTLDRARPYVDVVRHIRAQDFTFGGALNVGAAAASGSLIFALSAHCTLPDREWMARSIAHYADEQVAASFGIAFDPRGVKMTDARALTFADVAGDPHWGFTNHASSWRRIVWEELAFDETVRSCEDKQWIWRVMGAGWTVIADPSLLVSSEHRRSAGLRALWKREFLEHATVVELLDYPVPTVVDTVRSWWGNFPWPSRRPYWQRRLSPWRNTEYAAGFLGERAGLHRRGARTIRLPVPPDQT